MTIQEATNVALAASRAHGGGCANCTQVILNELTELGASWRWIVEPNADEKAGAESVVRVDFYELEIAIVQR